MRPLDALLSQPEQRLLGKVLVHPNRDFGTLELLQHMGSSRSAGTAIVGRCLEVGLLRERRVGNQRRLSANPGFVLYPELRKIVLKAVALAQPLAEALAPVADKLTEAFIFGSVAQGTDRSDSDIELAVVGKVDLFSISHLLDAVQGELGRDIHLSVYSPTEWAATDDPVVAAVRAVPRIDLMGSLRAATL